MARWVVVVLVLLALGFGYRVLRPAGAGAAAALRPEEDAAAEALPGAVPAPAVPVATAAAAEPLDEDPATAAIAAGVLAGDASALGQAWRALRVAKGAPRARLAEALERAAAGRDVAELLALLGPSNAFLHSDEGRRLCRTTIERCRAEPAESSVKALTTLLEACMRGDIARADVAARATVDEAYAALQPGLRQTLFHPRHLQRARSYQVKPGEALERIARQLRRQELCLDAGTLALCNGIHDPGKLRAGQVLKIPIDPVRTVIEKPSFLMAVYVGDVLGRLYWIGHGKDGRTPETTFVVESKQEHPDWYAEGRVVPYGHPDNVLGDYFVKFRHATLRGFGAHGTAEPESLGTMASAGCIRMADADIADYFRIVPVGSQVEIRATR